ncbi:MAG: hypothetical protein DCF19_16185 [Pseudanabaena frigida]|uniref:Uncharacterized protein n=1 Tax=Pseudanabaena frigida TaxID=945775 RepID=A0A2W4W1P4_9CYAN|nr:MAG: hypothetical protein DCF19_16185 [Pseudanabaena frigida]
MGNNTSTAIKSATCLVLDILCNEFGHEKVSQSLKYQKYNKAFKDENHRLVSDSFNMLSYQWQMGRSREYLESLDIEVQYSLICSLAENYINDKSRTTDYRYLNDIMCK